MNFRVTTIPLHSPVSSLLWIADRLVDLASGGNAYSLDGSFHPSSRYRAFSFDAAIVSPTGRYSVIYKRLGTKALLLEGNEIVRELNRSYYHAEVYEYPITFAQAADGTELIIHCPDEYCRIDIEVAATGDRLSTHPERAPQDIFHSRLTVSPDGRWLVSAGWVWHPFGIVVVFDLHACLFDSRKLDSTSSSQPQSVDELDVAVFDQSSRLVLASTGDVGSIESPDPQRLAPGQIGVWNPDSSKFEMITNYGSPSGSIMPLGKDHIVSFFGHPKVIELASGGCVQEWPEVNSGKQCGSIIHHIDHMPVIACDPGGQRFAVADRYVYEGNSKITVVEVSL